MSGSPYERLAEVMEDRRLELGLSWDEVADASGKSPATLRAVRNGTTNPGPLTKRGIERALQWSAGSVDRVLGGGEPTRVVSGRLGAQLPGVRAEMRGEAVESAEEDPFERLDRVYREWRQEVELDEAGAVREAEAVRTVLESFRDRKTG